MSVLNLAYPTPGDTHFYDRWKVFGKVYNAESIYAYDGDCEILVVDHRTTLQDSHLALFPSLKYVCSATTGTTHLQFQSEKIKLIHLTDKEFLRGVRSVSEFVFRLIFELVRPLYSYGNLLSGKTIAVVGGMGRIGTHVYELATAFKMKPLILEKWSPEEQWPKVLSLSDFVTIHIPETKENLKFFDSNKIVMMKKGSYLINTSRGSIIDEQALVGAVHAGHIAGAALDTIDDSTVFLSTNYKKVIISSHRAGSTIEDRIKTDEHLVECLKRSISLEGHPLPENPPLPHLSLPH